MAVSWELELEPKGAPDRDATQKHSHSAICHAGVAPPLRQTPEYQAGLVTRRRFLILGNGRPFRA